MKTKLFALLLLSAFAARSVDAAEDPFTAIRAALAQNQLEVAATALVPLVAAENPDPRALLYLSQVRARQHQTKEAIALAKRAVAAEPTRAEFQSNLGVVLGQRAGEVSFVQQAFLAGPMLGAFKKSVELDPEHIPGYIGLARYYTNAPGIAGGGREPAERYARELEKRNAQLGSLELANIAEHFDDPAAAYALYTKAAANQPQAAWIQEALGRLSEKLAQPTQARAHYEKAVELDPTRAAANEALQRLAAGKS